METSEVKNKSNETKKDLKRKHSQNVEVLFRKWIKDHDPQNVKKRKEYANLPEVQERRKRLGRQRRTRYLAAINLIKSGGLEDTAGNKYYFLKSRLIKEDFNGGKKYILKGDKSGQLFSYPYIEEDDLENSDIDAPIIEDRKIQLSEKIVKLLEGDPEVEKAVKWKMETTKKDIKDEECYWKSLTPEEKNSLLSKIAVN